MLTTLVLPQHCHMDTWSMEHEDDNDNDVRIAVRLVSTATGATTLPISNTTSNINHNSTTFQQLDDADTSGNERITITDTSHTGKKRSRSIDLLTTSHINDNDEAIVKNANRTTTRRRKEKNERKSTDDAYHRAYEGYQYSSVYFTYDTQRAESLLSLSSKIQYHRSSSTSTTTTTIDDSAHNSDKDNIIHTIIPAPPPPPGTPLCYYKASYLVTYEGQNNINNHPNQDNHANYGTEIIAEMMVHQHVNGLCVVCVANLETILQQQEQQVNSGDTDDSHSKVRMQFQYQVQVTSSELSLAQKRKRNTKQLQGRKSSNNDHTSNNIGLVQPSDALATLIVPPLKPSAPAHPSFQFGNTSTNDTIEHTTKSTSIMIRFPSCVMGSIIELNEQFMNNKNDNNHRVLQLLQSDPYLKGYLAIILPSGPFPPSTS